jgi:hypothetical protein
MKTVLMLSRFFPPAFDVGGKRAYRFARYLGQHGWRAVVLTERVPTDRRTDDTPVDLPPEVEVVREYLPRFGRFYGNAGTDGTNPTPVAASSGRASLLRWPIASDLWLAPRFAWLVDSLAERYRPDAVFASSSPYTALVFGAIYKAMTGTPLCLDLRDPWTLNFLQQGKPAWAQRVDTFAERRLFDYADQVTVTCASARDAYRALYPHLPADKIQCIYNSFDPAQRPEPAPVEANSPLTLVHFGNCYGARSLAPILQAIASLRARGALAAGQVRLRNFGRLSVADLELAATLGVADALEAAPVVPYAEGIAQLAAADLQILLGYGEHTLFVPAKLYDYLLAGAPILCVTPESELSAMVRATGRGVAAELHETHAIERALLDALDRRAAPLRAPHASDAAAQYSSPETARQLATLLDALVSHRP